MKSISKKVTSRPSNMSVSSGGKRSEPDKKQMIINIGKHKFGKADIINNLREN